MNIRKISKRKVFLLIGDIIIIILSFNFSFFIRLGKSLFHLRNLYEGISLTFLVLVIFLLSFYIFGLYNINENFRSIRFLNLVLISLFSASLISFLLFYAFPFILGRGLFLISLFFIGAQAIVWRLIFSFFFRMAVPQRNVLLVGEGKAITAINSLLEKNPDYKVIGILTTKRKKEEGFDFSLHRNIPSLEELANKHKINDIVVAVDLARNKRLNRAIINCRLKGINVYDMATFYEHLMDKLPVSLLKESWFFYCDGFEKLGNTVYKRFKRIADFTLSFLLLLISLPLIVLIILLIKS
ncbi:MAG: nucleoside-diphosphate sugar epimerase/dehydratase, partial [Candidatus Helarchaeota archaeon]